MPIIRAATPPDPRFAVIAGEGGYRNIIATFIRTEWPHARIDEIDPFSQTMLGLGVTLKGECDAIIVAGLGTYLEASSALKRLSSGAGPEGLPPVILLVGIELEHESARLIAEGAAAVYLRDSISRSALVNALSGLAPRQTGSAPHPFPARHDAAKFGRFDLAVEGEQIRIGIENFRPTRLLGSTKLSTVFAAERIADGHQAVVKIGTGAPYHDDTMARRFCDRYGFLSRQTDGSIVRYLDAGIAGSWPYIVIEHLGRADLRHKLVAPLDPSEALALMMKVLDAIDTLHRGRMAHLDLKPENIFFRDDGSVVLIDFNISMPFGSAARSHLPGDVVGSPYYLSPEQGRGMPVDARSDFYSLGVILFEMVAGKRPFDGENSVQVIFKHLHEEIPFLPKRARGLQPLIDTLLAKQPAERPADGDALRALLQNHLDAPRQIGDAP
jgi:Protein kinase domain